MASSSVARPLIPASASSVQPAFSNRVTILSTAALILVIAADVSPKPSNISFKACSTAALSLTVSACSKESKPLPIFSVPARASWIEETISSEASSTSCNAAVPNLEASDIATRPVSNCFRPSLIFSDTAGNLSAISESWEMVSATISLPRLISVIV